MMLILIILAIVALILRYKIKVIKYDRLKRIIQGFNSSMFFNAFIRFFIEGYLEISISIILSYQKVRYNILSNIVLFHWL